MKHTDLVLKRLHSFWILPLRDRLLGSNSFLQRLASGNSPQLLSGSREDGRRAGRLYEKGPRHLQDGVEFEGRDDDWAGDPESLSGRSRVLFWESQLFGTHTVGYSFWTVHLRDLRDSFVLYHPLWVPAHSPTRHVICLAFPL